MHNRFVCIITYKYDIEPTIDLDQYNKYDIFEKLQCYPRRLYGHYDIDYEKKQYRFICVTYTYPYSENIWSLDITCMDIQREYDDFVLGMDEDTWALDDAYIESQRTFYKTKSLDRLIQNDPLIKLYTYTAYIFKCVITFHICEKFVKQYDTLEEAFEQAKNKHMGDIMDEVPERINRKAKKTVIDYIFNEADYHCDLNNKLYTFTYYCGSKNKENIKYFKKYIKADDYTFTNAVDCGLEEFKGVPIHKLKHTSSEVKFYSYKEEVICCGPEDIAVALAQCIES